MKSQLLLFFSISVPVAFTGCATHAEKKEDARIAAMLEESYELAVKQRNEYSSIIQMLKPQAFAEVGLYRVRVWDTGVKIAREHGLSISDLMKLNPDVDWSKLHIGQVVRVRAPEEKKEG
jgi:predicted RNase H-like HicB family nuclease